MNLTTTELSIEDQIAVLSECMVNPLTWFSNVHIEDATTFSIIPFELWEHLKDFICLVYNNKFVVVVKARQIGISWALAGIAIHHCYKQGARVLMISKGKDEAAELLGKAKFIHSHLPPYLQMDAENWGTFYVKFKQQNSSILALPSTEDAGIGYTASLVICDENEFHTYAERNFSNVKPTVEAGDSKMVVVSATDETAGLTHFKKLYRDAHDGSNNFVSLFLPYSVRPGRDEDWYERTAKDYPSYMMHKLYPRTEVEALSLAGQRSIINTNILESLFSICKESKPKEVRHGNTYIFQYPEIGMTYTAGADCSEGKGGDYQALLIFGSKGVSTELVAVIHTNILTLDTFAYESYELLGEYFNPYLVCGADAFSGQFLNYLVGLGYHKEKIYCTDKKREKLGYLETKDNKKQNAVDLESFLKNTVIRYEPAVRELMNFNWTDAGTPEVGQGTHDDLISAIEKAMIAYREVDKHKKNKIKVYTY